MTAQDMWISLGDRYAIAEQDFVPQDNRRYNLLGGVGYERCLKARLES